jgi:galactoside O-acetyltransferase
MFSRLYILISWIPSFIGSRIRSVFYNKWFIYLGKNAYFDSHVDIDGFKSISIGDNFKISKYSKLTSPSISNKGSLKIGNNVSLNRNVNINAKSGEITIGNDVLISYNCVLRASNHNFDDLSMPIKYQGNTFGKIVIEDNVWIGANVVITSNVTIKKGSIIGAGSVVTKDVEANSIAVGVPAKIIKKRK